MADTLPNAGLASTYSDYFENKQVADSTSRHPDYYTHKGFTAALLGSHRGAVPFGTKLRLTYRGRNVVVVVNDVGRGKSGEDRVLDLSRAAMACLTGRKVDEITDANASVITLDGIVRVDGSVPVGCVGAGP